MLGVYVDSLRCHSPARRIPALESGDHRGRNVIERSFNDTKQWRGLATRYDRLAIVYRGAVVLRAVTIRLNALNSR